MYCAQCCNDWCCTAHHFCVRHKQCRLQVSFQPFQGRGSPRREQPGCAGGHCVGHSGPLGGTEDKGLYASIASEGVPRQLPHPPCMQALQHEGAAYQQAACCTRPPAVRAGKGAALCREPGLWLTHAAAHGLEVHRLGGRQSVANSLQGTLCWDAAIVVVGGGKPVIPMPCSLQQSHKHHL